MEAEHEPFAVSAIWLIVAVAVALAACMVLAYQDVVMLLLWQHGYI